MMSSAERQDKVKRRSDMACTNCRARKLKCENKDSIPPCKRCEHDHKPDCQFVSVAEDKSRGTSEPEQKFTPQFTHSLAPVSGRSQNSGVSTAPANAHRQSQSRPPINRSPDLPYQPSYDGYWSSQSQGQYALQSNSRLSYPQPTGAGMSPSPYPFAQPSNSPYVQQSFTSDAHTSVMPQNMYYLPNTMQEASQGVHSSPPYYQRNEQPSGVVYCDPTTVPGLNSRQYQYPQ